MPSSLTLSRPRSENTPDPLSPPPTTAAPAGLLTNVWQSSTVLDPKTPVCTQLRVTSPCVHPVVRPTLLTTVPSAKLVVKLSCDETVNTPATVSEPLLAPVVLRMSPWFDAVPLA